MTTETLIRLHAANRELRAAIHQIVLLSEELPYWLVSPCRDGAEKAIEAVDKTIERVHYIRETVVDKNSNALDRIIIPMREKDV